MMTEVDNACSKSGVKKMEGENSVKTVDCLRGRLLAERLASRNAKEETKQLENKLMELENMLKQEAKSRNRAEKRLKLLFKKLESNNISYGSEYSGLEGKSDISSLSNNISYGSEYSGTQESTQNGKSEQGSENNQNQNNNLQKVLFSLSDDNSCSTIEVRSSYVSDFQGCEMGQIENQSFPDLSDHFEDKNIAQNFKVENFLFSEGDDAKSEKSDHLGFDQNCQDSKMDEQSEICYHRFRFSTEDGFKKEEGDDGMNGIDNSMALVAIDTPHKNRTIDPEILDSAVKQVLEALKRAKEQLQSSIEKKRVNIIRVG